MDELEPETEATDPPDDEEETVRRLLESAGPRPSIPQGDLDVIANAARAEWRRQVARQAPPALTKLATGARRRRTALVASLAAALALAVGIAWWAWRPAGPAGDTTVPSSPATPPTVAWVEAVKGSVDLVAAAGEPHALAVGEAILLGGELRSERTGRASLRLADGATVRLDVETRLRLLSATSLQLTRGALYADTGSGGSGRGPRSSPPAAALEVRTPLGTARDVGTRFAVRIVGAEAKALVVRVRDGAVLTARGDRTFHTRAGQELILRRDGASERHRAAVYGPDWDWVLAAAGGFDVEGRSLQEFLDWVSRETGWRIVLADESLARSASEIVLHGSLGGLRPDQAPFAVLPGAGLTGELADGTLVVRSRPAGLSVPR